MSLLKIGSTRGALFTLVLIVMAASPLLAQQEACLAAYVPLFHRLEQNCLETGLNTACYGEGAVQAIPPDETVASWTQPGDTMALADVKMLAALVDRQNGAPGLALLQTPANLSTALYQDGLKMFLIGSVEMVNAVSPDDAFEPAEPVPGELQSATALRRYPSNSGQIIANLEAGTPVLVDVRSADDNWLRIIAGEQTGWVVRQAVVSQPELNALPQLRSNRWALMQDFYLWTIGGYEACSRPPSMLLLQAPPGQEARIRVNGVPIIFSATIALHILPDGQMQAFVYDGTLYGNGLSLPAGFVARIPLDETGRAPDGSWRGARPIAAGERDWLLSVSGLFPTLLYTPLRLPSEEEVGRVAQNFGGANAAQPLQEELSELQPTPTPLPTRPPSQPSQNSSGGSAGGQTGGGSTPIIPTGVPTRVPTAAPTGVPTTVPPTSVGDSDGDGILDNVDGCVNQPGPVSNNGCPVVEVDADGDGFKEAPNNADLCPGVPGTINGCPDSDGDGIPDTTDGCPGQAGPASNNGCPAPVDSDGDGIPDTTDGCPGQAGPASNNGCPVPVDSDGDGFPDSADACPNEFGLDNGCPTPPDVGGAELPTLPPETPATTEPETAPEETLPEAPATTESETAPEETPPG